MNATQNAVKNAIVRFDEDAKKPVIIYADTIPEGGVVKAYVEGKGEVEMSIEQYRNTGRLNMKEQQQVLDTYKRFVGAEEIHLRQRLPYTKDIAKVEDKLADVNLETGEVTISDELVAQSPESHKAVLKNIQQKNAKRAYNKKSEYWFDASIPKGRARSGHAKTIEAQDASVNKRSLAQKKRVEAEIAATNNARFQDKEAHSQDAAPSADANPALLQQLSEQVKSLMETLRAHNLV